MAMAAHGGICGAYNGCRKAVEKILVCCAVSCT